MADLSFVNTREFSRLISKPSTLTVFDMAMLEDLVELYPFSYPLHISYAYALNKFKPEKFDEYISKAAAYTPDRKLLYKILNNSEFFEGSDLKKESGSFAHATLQEVLEESASASNNLISDDIPAVEIAEDVSMVEPSEVSYNDEEQPVNETIDTPVPEFQDEVEEEIPGTDNINSELPENSEFEHRLVEDENSSSEPENIEQFEETSIETDEVEEHVSDELDEAKAESVEAGIADEPEEFTDAVSEVENIVDDEGDINADFSETESFDQHTDNSVVLSDPEDLVEDKEIESEVVAIESEHPIENESEHLIESIDTSSEVEDLVDDEPVHSEISEIESGDQSDEEDVHASDESSLTTPESDAFERKIEEEPVFEEPDLNEQVADEELAEPEQVVAEEEDEIEQNNEESEKEESNVSHFSFQANSFDNTIETVIPFSEHPSFEEPIDQGEEIIQSTNSKEAETVSPEEISPEEDEIIGSVASVDYFVFDKSVIDPLQKEEELEQSAPAEVERTYAEPVKKEAISRYDDDKMPFSFLWWLDKTRKEHADNYQPYASKSSVPPDLEKPHQIQLNQQIIENIFHIQPEINVFQNQISNPISFGIKRREDVLIEKFINEDPQIRPPKGDKLDTENKARKSSEDNLDLVSETLARIYTDQMLYHKAIDTYQKLSLKFPEKSTYFAGQIRELEKKFN